MPITPEVLQALVEYDRGRLRKSEDIIALQAEELLSLSMGLTEKGRHALLAHYRLALTTLNTALTRDHHGYWWVHQGRNSDYNRALDQLLGKPEPRPKLRKGPNKPKQVIT